MIKTKKVCTNCRISVFNHRMIKDFNSSVNVDDLAGDEGWCPHHEKVVKRYNYCEDYEGY